MAPTLSSSAKRRRVEEGMQGKVRPKKKFRKQRDYHSDSDEDEEETTAAAPSKSSKQAKAEESQSESEEGSSASEDNDEFDADDASVSESDSQGGDSDDAFSDDDDTESTKKQRKLPKRSDPNAFSTSISKILSTKLPTSARSDPLLSRSQTTAQASAELANERLEARAKAKLRAQKKEELERGRVKDVMGVERGEAGETAEAEKRLRKVAQRGVIKLFNAVRAAQVRGEELAREERRKRTTIGMDERRKLVNEVSKEGFLEMINGKGNKKTTIEEA